MERKKKTVILGVCGGIAAYKACDLASRLVKLGYEVEAVMTKSAQEFISPLTLMTLTGHHVVTGMFEEPASYDVEHISVAKKADLFLLVPATANVIGKIANGIADDFLTTTVMATKAPVLIAPAMNSGMWSNPVLKQNIEKCKALGYHFVDPEEGRLACGDVGEGKLRNLDDILEAALCLLCEKKDLAGKTVLVTAGPTQEKIDPVRYLTNPSSGKMGYAVARRAYQRGAQVILVAGKTVLRDPYGVDLIRVESALEMYDAVMAHQDKADIIIKSAAVGDYRAETQAAHKIKKSEDKLILELVKNPDILLELGKRKKDQILVGFCMETQNLEEYAAEKLKHKNLDLIVANQLNQPGAGFAVDTNAVTILTRDGKAEKLPVMSKEMVADVLLDKVVSL